MMLLQDGLCFLKLEVDEEQKWDKGKKRWADKECSVKGEGITR
jgi:hypothetical protein